MDCQLNSLDEDHHYCLKCKKIIIGLDNYVAHRKSNCNIISSNESTVSNLSLHCHDDESSRKFHDKEIDESFDDGVMDLSTSTKRIENRDDMHKSLLRSDVTLTSSSVRQHDEHVNNYKQVKLFASGGYVEPYAEVDTYSNFISSRGPSLFTDYRSSNVDHSRNKELFPRQHHYSEPGDLFQTSNQESPGGAFRPLETFPDQLKSPSHDVENSGYFSRFTGGKYIVEPQNYENKVSELYSAVSVATSGSSYMSPGVTDTVLYKQKIEVNSMPIDYNDSTQFLKPINLEKSAPKDKELRVCSSEKDASEKEECSVSPSYQKHPEEIRQNDFFSSLELTSNIGKKTLRYVSEDEDDDDFDDSRPPRHHTGGKWPPGTHPPPTVGGKWLLSPTSVEEEDEIQVDFEVVDEDDSIIRHPPPSYTKGKWLPGKRMTNLEVETVDEFFCKSCDRSLKGKAAYQRHLRSELHLIKRNKYLGIPFDEDMGTVTKRPQRAKKLQAQIFLKKTISKIKKRKRNGSDVKKKETTISLSEHDHDSDKEVDSSDEINNHCDSKIMCPICRLSFSKEYCSRHFASLAHIHNELQYKINPSSETDKEYSQIIRGNIASLVSLSNFKCSSCRFYTNSHSDLETHLRCHDEDESEENSEMKTIYQCSACSGENELFLLKDVIRHLHTTDHLANVKDEILQAHQVLIKTYIRLCCPLCENSFKFNRAYRNHRRNQHGGSKFQLSQQRFLHCSECYYQDTSERQMRDHLQRVHKIKSKKLYFCFVCGLRFPTTKEAEAHRQSVIHRITIEKNKGKSISRRCNICYAETESLMQLRLHMTEHHCKEITPCPYCGILPPLRSDLTNHLRTCSRTEIVDNKRAFKCDLCDFSNDLSAHVLMHVVFAHGEQAINNNYACHICKTRMQARSVRNHMLLHTSEWKFACKYCSRKFAHEGWLSSHLSTVHSSCNQEKNLEQICESSHDGDEGYVNVFNANSNRSLKDILCEICGKTFKSKSSLKRHQHDLHIFGSKSASEVISDLPELHGPNVNSASNLNMSNCEITQPMTLICDVCAKECNSLAELKSHRLKHRDKYVQGASYPCPHCSYTTQRMHHLRRHLRLHTGATPFKCAHCNYSANNQENLRKHLLQTQKHSGRFMYECQLCWQKTSDLQNVGSGTKKIFGMGKQSLPVAAVFGTNYATEFKTHLNAEHKDHFRDKDEVIRHIRSYYHSDQDPTFTDNPKPFKHKPRKRQSRSKLNENLVGDVEEMAIDEELMLVSAPAIISHSNMNSDTNPITTSSAFDTDVSVSTSHPNSFSVEPNVSSSLILYSESTGYPNKLPVLATSSTQKFNNPYNVHVNETMSGRNQFEETGSEVLRNQLNTKEKVSISRDSKHSSFIIDPQQTVVYQVSSEEGNSLRDPNIQGGCQLLIPEYKQSIPGQQIEQNVKEESRSISTLSSPTTMKVYINKSTNRAYIVKGVAKSSISYIPKTPLQTKIRDNSVQGYPSPSELQSNCSRISAQDSKGLDFKVGGVNPAIQLQAFQDIRREIPTSSSNSGQNIDNNISKKFFLIIPGDKSIEEQVINILPSLDL